MMFGPWRRAVEAQLRAAAAEERAAFLEAEINWLRGQMETAHEAESRANKIVANVFAQPHGFVPFPEVEHLPEPKSEPLSNEFIESARRPREEAAEDFVENEMKRWEESHK